MTTPFPSKEEERGGSPLDSEPGEQGEPGGIRPHRHPQGPVIGSSASASAADEGPVREGRTEENMAGEEARPGVLGGRDPGPSRRRNSGDAIDSRRQQQQQQQQPTAPPSPFPTPAPGCEPPSPSPPPAPASAAASPPVAGTRNPSGAEDAVYDRFPRHRKAVMVALLSFCSFLSPVSSTSVLAATPEVAAEYGTDGTVVNVVNAVYMLMMGVSPVVWGPMSEVYGRRRINQVTAVLFFACSIGSALAPNLAAFFVFRVLTAFEGTAFILVGSACIGDIYRPTERATALGWFLSGTLIGPAFGPFLGGIIVTYTSWRVIFWLQTALSGLAALFTFSPFLPETIHHRKVDDLALTAASRRQQLEFLWRMVNPVRVLRLFIYPNLVAASLASSAVIWNMYGLLTPIRYVLNPCFDLTTPMQSGLFYLAPGTGYLVGTLIGGRYADHVVKAWITRRGGVRVPEDRLRSAVPFMGVIIPGCLLVYGWGVEREVGGIPLVVVTLFLQGVAQLFCFPSLNTYCLDVMQGRGAEVIAGNYFVRYLFACAVTACVLPAVRGIGVGWFSTITALFLIASTAAIMATIRWGKRWRESVDERRRLRKMIGEMKVRQEEEEEEHVQKASQAQTEKEAIG